jgi:hypothetical protein
MADAALARLAAPVPERHAKKELTERLSWFSGDPVANALDLLDDLLAIDPAPPFDALQDRLVQTVATQWQGWPPFTRALTLSSLRVWFWHRFPRLRTLLAEAIRSEPNPVVVRYAVDRLVEIVRAAPTPELPAFLNRAAAGGHGDALRRVAQVLGEAAVVAHQTSAGKRAGELADLLRQALASECPDADALGDFLEGALMGATDSVTRAEPRGPGAEDAWLRTVESLVAHWPFAASGKDDRERFPVHVLWSVIEGETSPEDRARVFLGLARTLETLLRNADLAAFCNLHFELNRLIAGWHQHIPGQREREWRAGIPVSESVEDALRALCRASVDRVVAWKREGKTTDDLAWRSGLDGRNSAELVKSCLDASRDRERMKRGLIPLADVLADAGLTQVAADLRAHLRKA